MSTTAERPDQNGATRPELRAHPRRRVLKSARIEVAGRPFYSACLVRDISETGARVVVENGYLVPASFDLMIELDGIAVACAVAWRRLECVGVRFTGPLRRICPPRVQVIGTASTYRLPRPSLRRTPVAA